MSVEITVQETPNPAARRFVLDKPVQEETRGRFYTDPDDADDELATSLLRLDGVSRVMLLPTSVTVTKVEDASWQDVEASARQALEDYFA